VEKIKVGVIGVGYLGQFHAEKYAKIEEVELVGVADISPSRAEEIARRYRTRPFFHHSELLNRVQAVSVAVPTPLHYSVTQDFLQKGIDVLLEKPITQTLGEANELIALAESKGLILQVGHSERFNGALIALEGMIRDPWLIESHRLGPFLARAANVNVVLDLMIHDIDIILHLVNSEVKEIHGTGLPLITDHLDIANARIEFENGCTANLTASRLSEERSRRTQIFQPDGIFSIDYLSQKAFFSQKVKEQQIVTREIPVKKADPLAAEIHSFVRSVRDRKQTRVPGRDGKRALEVALEVVEKIGELAKKRDGKGRA
jgi:predicted dehydrogenase